MKALVLATLLLVGISASAVEVKQQVAKTLTGYSCDVRVFAKDLPNGMAESKFDRPLQGGVHGGQAAHFEFGKHVVEALVDSKWRNLTWWQNGKLVAASVSAKSEVVTGYDTVIIYNPANPEEEAHIACAPKF